MIKTFKNVLDYYLFDPEFETNEYIYELFCQRILEIKIEKYVLIYDTDDEIDSNNKENCKKLFLNRFFEQKIFKICIPIINSTFF